MTHREWDILRRELWIWIGVEVYYQRLCALAQKLDAVPPTRKEFIGGAPGTFGGAPAMTMIKRQLLRGWAPITDLTPYDGTR